jgi:hypothetical protein
MLEGVEPLGFVRSISVSTAPGATTLTRIERVTSSRLRLRLNASSPPFDAA